ncbi:MAG: rhomboid family intramembrane serine protease, partial [Phycisphaerae bacterium]|nr:rhomboid family intramembrane serine protease [Phycisphaerae bacterium]
MIPIGTDRRLKHRPWVNYAIVAANIFVFIVLQQTRSDTPGVRTYLLWPDKPEVYQFFSCMFMHGGWGHLLGNMIFLWVFGNAVNDSLGNVGYLAFYLAGGVIAGVGYVLLSGTAPVLGASGAISAVTGAFLVLFPRVRVTVLLI